MCGLAGKIGVCDSRDREAMAVALDKLRHRGPDDSGLEAGSNWLLGFRRLSILDLAPTGHQPMLTPERDAALVFNGEIYNFPELREELRAHGETCRSSGDAEVLLRWLRREGSAALDRLNGMFAIAFIDLRTRRFLLARDRLGVKPLYYSRLEDSIVFASELPALFGLLPRQPEMDRLALNRYMAFGHIAPPLTIWQGVNKLPPGCRIEGTLDLPSAAECVTWWQLQVYSDDRPTTDQWVDQIDGLLSDAIDRRLVADVPVGVFLSGGVDSSLVSHYVGRSRNAHQSVAVTVDFDDAEFSEGAAAAKIASTSGLEHHRLRVTVDNLADLPAIAWHCGEPFADASVVNEYSLAKAARSQATVFLTGDGGDEAFGGYDEYVRMARSGATAAVLATAGPGLAALGSHVLPTDSLLLQRLFKLSGGSQGFGALVRQNFRDPVFSELLDADWRAEAPHVEAQIWKDWGRSAGLPLMTRLQRLDYGHYLESDVLVKVDRATMAWGIEARSPFLDYRLVELAGRIPHQQHLAGTLGKQLLRRLMARHFPQPLLNQPKRGFALPISRWFKEGLAEQLEAQLLERPRPWWNVDGLKAFFRWHARGARDLHQALWRVLMLEMWARVFIDGDRSDWRAHL